MSTRCFRKSSIGGIFDASNSDFPCPNQNLSPGGFVGCCVSGDACLANGFCTYSHAQRGGSGFYIQSCTDSTYKDSACPQFCTDQIFSDVVYNATTESWACCGSVNVGSDTLASCGAPTEETFGASPLWPLYQSANAIVNSIITSSSSTPTGTSSTSSQSSTTSTYSASATSTQQNPSQSSSHWPKGEEIGVGLGVGVAVLALLGFLLWRISLARRLLKLETQRQSSQGSTGEESQNILARDYHGQNGPIAPRYASPWPAMAETHEVPNTEVLKTAPTEMPNDNYTHELQESKGYLHTAQ